MECIVMNLEKTDRVLTAPHCTLQIVLSSVVALTDGAFHSIFISCFQYVTGEWCGLSGLFDRETIDLSHGDLTLNKNIKQKKWPEKGTLHN